MLPVPPVKPTKRTREAETPSMNSQAKRVRTSHGAAALQNMSESLAGFGTALTAALQAPPPTVAVHVQPSPVRRTAAISALLHLEKDWLDLSDQVKLIDFLRTDITAAEVYTALEHQLEVRKKWVQAQLLKL